MRTNIIKIGIKVSQVFRKVFQRDKFIIKYSGKRQYFNEFHVPLLFTSPIQELNII